MTEPFEPRRSTFRKFPAIALLPDGSSESFWATDSPIGYLDREGRQIRFPKGTRILPFPEGELFWVAPTYREAEKKNLGHRV